MKGQTEVAEYDHAVLVAPKKSASAACSGDSGGPAYVRSKNGKEMVAGIASMALPDETGQPIASFFARLDNKLENIEPQPADWIRQFTE